MNIFEIDSLMNLRRQGERPYLEFFRVPALSAGIYSLPAHGVDGQKPHTEDEIYYVVRGRGAIQVDGVDAAVGAGSLIYVAAQVPHHFHTITEDLEILVLFAPAEYSLQNAPSAQNPAKRGDFTISTDIGLLDLDMVYNYLAEESYWSNGLTREKVGRFVHHSLCYGVYHDGQQVGFGRVITDFTTTAYLADIFIVPAYQGQGLGKWLVQTILQHPELQDLRSWTLKTRDAQDFYRRFGFKELETTKRSMEFRPGE